MPARVPPPNPEPIQLGQAELPEEAPEQRAVQHGEVNQVVLGEPDGFGVRFSKLPFLRVIIS